MPDATTIHAEAEALPHLQRLMILALDSFRALAEEGLVEIEGLEVTDSGRDLARELHRMHAAGEWSYAEDELRQVVDWFARS